VSGSQTRKKKPAEDVPLDEVVALFREHLKRGPWPNMNHCYRLTIDINTVRKLERLRFGAAVCSSATCTAVIASFCGTPNSPAR
jgi:hypothetical protein